MSPKLNQSVVKAISLLRAAAEEPVTTVSALARAAQLPRPTAVRLIQTLESEGFLLRLRDAERVLIGPELVRLARAGDLGVTLREVASGPLRELSARVSETVTLSAVSTDANLDLIYQVDGPQHLLPRSWIGQRFPLHASSSGKVLLASWSASELERFLREPLLKLTAHTITTPDSLIDELTRVRTQGYAETVDELEVGLAGVSVPIHADSSRLIGAVNVNGLGQRFDTAARERASDATLETAREIERALGRAGDGA